MLTRDRQELIKTLNTLPASYFDQLVFVLQAPSERLPDKTAPLSDRVTALLHWAESAGPGLKTVQKTLNQLLDKEPPTLPTVCPYKGLSYFDCNDRDHQFFYGREALKQALLAKIEQENFLAIVGASGSGKSSVLRAGVLQQLKDAGDTEIRLLVPGEHPLQSLALAFVDETAERLDRAEQQQQAKRLVESGAEGLCALVETSNKPRVMLVVDQFEESFTLCHDRAEREQFFATLLGALQASDTLTLILAMRSDFVGKCFEADYSGLATQVKTHLEPVLPMSQDELIQAIAAPARQVGLTLEPGLVEALLKDIDPTSGSLPLLQYTLTALWQRQQDNQLKLSAYMQLGGVTGTLQQRADAVYNSLTPAQQHTAKHIFLSLTQLGEGAEDTRRRITQASLISAQHPEVQVTTVIKRLVDANLVVTDDRTLENGQRTATVNVAHEALIRNWPKLRKWLDDNRDLLRQQRRIEQAVVEWSQQPKPQQKRYLLEGRQLSDAQAFRKKHGKAFPLSQQSNDFINRSQHQRFVTWIKLSSVLIIPVTFTYFVVEPNIRQRRVDAERAEIRQGKKDIREAMNYMVKGCRVQRIWKQIPSWLLEPIFGGCIRLSDNYDLHSANLSSANLNSADLRYADFSDADLRSADLRHANLGSASLGKADLRSSRLNNAILLATDLRETLLDQDSFTQENSPLICNTLLPKNIDAQGGKDRDCDKLPKVLLKRYPDFLDTLEQAEMFVEKRRQQEWE
ncbi:MAG: pentapeptide repeat-containing protein [Cyanobacteria bacterium P01_C01_bin.120]